MNDEDILESKNKFKRSKSLKMNESYKGEKSLNLDAKSIADYITEFAEGLAQDENALKVLGDNNLKALDAVHTALQKFSTTYKPSQAPIRAESLEEDLNEGDELEEGILDIVKNTFKGGKEAAKKAGETVGMAVHDAQTLKDVGRNIKQIYNQSKAKKIDQSPQAKYWKYYVTINGKQQVLSHERAMELADTYPEEITNAVVVDQEKYIVRRGTEDLRKSYVKYTPSREQIKDGNTYVDMDAKKLSGNPDSWLFIPKAAWEKAGNKIANVKSNDKMYYKAAREYMLKHGLKSTDFVIMGNNGKMIDGENRWIQDRLDDYNSRIEADSRRVSKDAEDKQRTDLQKHAVQKSQGAETQLLFNKISDLVFFLQKRRSDGRNSYKMIDPKIVSTTEDKDSIYVANVSDYDKNHRTNKFKFTELYKTNAKFKSVWDKAATKQKFESLKNDDDATLLIEGYSRCRSDVSYDDNINDEFNKQFI